MKALWLYNQVRARPQISCYHGDLTANVLSPRDCPGNTGRCRGGGERERKRERERQGQVEGQKQNKKRGGTGVRDKRCSEDRGGPNEYYHDNYLIYFIIII